MKHDGRGVFAQTGGWPMSDNRKLAAGLMQVLVLVNCTWQPPCQATAATAPDRPDDLSWWGGDLAARGPTPTNRENAVTWIEDLDRALAKRHGASTNYLLRPGLVANRQQRIVRLWATATGLTKDATAEFMLVGPDSGKSYEALCMSFTKPSDVHAALEFIGVKPGHTVDPSKLQFWPRGERVFITCEWKDGNRDRKTQVENLILDLRTGKPLAAQGMTFAGSYAADSPNLPSVKYAADGLGPRGIIANYNEPTIVLDVPRQSDQSVVYGRPVLNPEYLFAKDQLVQFVLEPEYRDGRQRAQAMDLHIAQPAGATAVVTALSYRLLDEGGKAVTTNTDLACILAYFGGLTAKGEHDLFVTLHFDTAMPLATVCAVAEFIGNIDNEKGIRVESPPKGEPYYRAFTPDPKFACRAGRDSQPWELRLEKPGAVRFGTLTRLEEQWDDRTPVPNFKAKDIEVANVEAMTKILNQFEWPKVLIVFAPASSTYGEIARIFKAATPPMACFYVFTN